MELDREALEPLLRQMISEILAESAPARVSPPPPAAAHPGHPVEVRVHPDGTVVVRHEPQAPHTEAVVWDPDCIYTCCTDCCTACICCQCGACIPGGLQLLSATFEAHTEEVFNQILEAEPMSRDQLIGHLWERVQKRLVHEEAVTFHAEQRGGGQALDAPDNSGETR